MWGDPQFITFDGLKTKFADMKKSNFWLVKSQSIQIQGYAVEEGSWSQGIAVSGSLLENNKLLAYRDSSNTIRIFWNGQEGAHHAPEELVRFHRESGSKHLPSAAVLKKIFAKGFCSSCLGRVMTAWRNSNIYTFKLPGKVEIYMLIDTFSPTSNMRKSVAVLIKMPPKGGHGGWCGNFNGQAGDDRVGVGPDQGAVPASENWFRGAADLPRTGRLLLMNMGNASEARAICEGKANMSEAAIQQVVQACAHIAEPKIRQGCIEDICTEPGFEGALEAADELAIMQGIMSDTPNECEPAR